MRPSKRTPDLVVGPLQDDDKRFVLNTWARSYRVSEACEAIPTAAYHRWQRPRMLAILQRALVLVARDRESPAYIYGYGVFERVGSDFVAHWVYTKADHKRSGVARILLASGLAALGDGCSKLVATHRTYVADKAKEMGFEHIDLALLEPYRDVDREVRACG